MLRGGFTILLVTTLLLATTISAAAAPYKVRCSSRTGPIQGGGTDRFPEAPAVHTSNGLVVTITGGVDGTTNTKLVALFTTNCSVAWRADIPTTSGALRPSTLSAASSRNIVLVASYNGTGSQVTAFDAASSGVRLWSDAPLINGPLTALLANDATYVVASEPKPPAGGGSGLVAYDVATGNVSWSVARASGPMALVPNKDHGARILFADSTRSIFTLADASDGRVLRWSPAIANVSFRSVGASAAAGVFVAHATRNGSYVPHLACFDLANSSTSTMPLVWNVPIGPTSGGVYDDVNGSPLFSPSGDRFTITVVDGLWAFNTDTGSLAWRFAGGGYTVHSGGYFLPDASAVIVSYQVPAVIKGVSPTSGATLWEVTGLFNNRSQCCAPSPPVMLPHGAMAIQGFGWNFGVGGVTIVDRGDAAKSTIAR